MKTHKKKAIIFTPIDITNFTFYIEKNGGMENLVEKKKINFEWPMNCEL